MSCKHVLQMDEMHIINIEYLENMPHFTNSPSKHLLIRGNIVKRCFICKWGFKTLVLNNQKFPWFCWWIFWWFEIQRYLFLWKLRKEQRGKIWMNIKHLALKDMESGQPQGPNNVSLLKQLEKGKGRDHTQHPFKGHTYLICSHVVKPWRERDLPDQKWRTRAVIMAFLLLVSQASPS